MAGNFVEINSIKVTKQRTIVISRNTVEDQIIIGQRMKTFDENDKEINFFLKGAIKIPLESLESLRDTMTEAIGILQDQGKLDKKDQKSKK